MKEVDTRDGPVLDLIPELLSGLSLVVQTALLEPEPGDVDKSCGIGRLPSTHRTDEGALNVQGVRADSLSKDVLGEHVAFLQQIRVACRCESLFRGTSPEPGLAAVPSTV